MMGQSLRRAARNASIPHLRFAPESRPGSLRSRFASIPRPVDPWGVFPQLFDAIVFPSLGREQVDDDITVVLHKPLAGLVAFDGKALLADAMQGGVDLLGEGVDLPPGRAGDEDEKVEERSLPAHVENE